MPYYKGVFFKELPPWAAKKHIPENLPSAPSDLAEEVKMESSPTLVWAEDTLTSPSSNEVNEQETAESLGSEPASDTPEVSKEAPAKRRKKKASVDV